MNTYDIGRDLELQNSDAPSQASPLPGVSHDQVVIKVLPTEEVIDDASECEHVVPRVIGGFGTPYTARELFDDQDTTTAGRVRAGNFGLNELKWCHASRILGRQTRSTYNLLHSPLNLLGATSKIRLEIVKFVDSILFDSVSLMFTVINAILLALDIPETSGEPEIQYMLSWTEVFFVIYFTLEMIVKVFAMGFISFQSSYLRDPWNIIDFVVVCSSHMSYFLSVSSSGVSVLRLLKLLRPLRTISRVPGMRVLIEALIRSMPAMADVFSMIVFVGFFFAIIGKELWAGMLHQRCYVTAGNMTDILALNVTRLCSQSAEGNNCNFITNGITLPQACKVGPWRSFLWTFDNMPKAMLHVFSLMTIEGWPDSMKNVQDANSEAVLLFYVAIIIFGSYLCMSLLIATLTNQYSVELVRQRRAMALERKRLKRCKSNELGLENITPATIVITALRPALGIYTSTSIELTERDDDRLGCTMAGSVVEDSTTEVAVASTSTEAEKKPSFFLRLLLHRHFSNLFLLIAIYNVIVISTDRYDASKDWKLFIDQSNFYCNVLFAAEMMLKLLVLGPLTYVKDPFNLMDGVLVLVSIPDMVLDTSTAAFTVLRALRMFRIIAMGRRLTSIHHIVRGVITSLKALGYLFLLIALFVFVMAILGVQFLGGVQVPSRNNFSTFGQSLLTVFILITGDGWTTILEEYVNATRSYWPIAYFLAVTGFGNLILVNQFVAISIESFRYSAKGGEDQGPASTERTYLFQWTWYKKLFQSPEAKEIRDKSRTKYLRHKENIAKTDIDPSHRLSSTKRLSVVSPAQLIFSYGPEVLKCASTVPMVNRYEANEVLMRFARTSLNVQPYAIGLKIFPLCFSAGDLVNWLIEENIVANTFGGIRYLRINFLREERMYLVTAIQAIFKEEKPLVKCIDKHSADMEILQTSMWTIVNEFENDTTPYFALFGKSLGIFYPDNKFRIFLANIVLHPHFETLIIGVILVNAVFLILDDPSARQNSMLQKSFEVVNGLCTGFFMLELCAKIIVYGLLLYDDVPDHYHKVMNVNQLSQPYLQSVMNCIDAFVALVSFGGLFFDSLRVFRSIRTLRLALRNKGMKTVLMAILAAFPAVLSLCFVLFLVQLIYAVLGTQLFSGKMFSCNDEDVISAAQCIGTFNTTVGTLINGSKTVGPVSRRWSNQEFNFDNVIQSEISLIVVALGEGWTNIMYSAMDAVDVGKQPIPNNQPYAAVFFVVYVMFGTFFAMNLLVGLLIKKISEMRSRYDGSALLTSEQKSWMRDYVLLRNLKLKANVKPKHPLRRFCYSVCCHELQSIQERLCGKKRLSEEEKRDQFENIDKTYTLDAFINVCVLLNILVMATEHYEQSEEQSNFVEITSFFFLSVYCVETALKLCAWGRRYFYETWNRFDFFIVLLSIPGSIVGNGAIQILRVFRAMRLLRMVRQLKGFVRLLTKLAQSLPTFLNITLLFFLFIFTFAIIGMEMCGGAPKDGEGLTEYIHFDDAARAFITLFTVATREGWYTVMDSCARYNWWSYPFFFIYMLILALVIVNLFTTVIIEIFGQEEMQEKSERFWQQLRVLKYHWSEEDTKATGILSVRRFIMILRNMKYPMGLNVHSFVAELGKLRLLVLPIDEKNNVRYVDAVYALAQRSLCVPEDEIAALHKYAGANLHPSCCFCIHHWYCARKIRVWWFRVLLKHRPDFISCSSHRWIPQSFPVWHYGQKDNPLKALPTMLNQREDDTASEVYVIDGSELESSVVDITEEM